MVELTRCSTQEVNDILRQYHYLGPSKRGFALRDDIGVVVFAAPTSRRLPHTWLELTRWCILTHTYNAGSQQWRKIKHWLIENTPTTTVVSYSDPSVGHTGALYRACNWLWAPTWHRLRPPPSGQGSWNTRKKESVKDRWVFPLRADPEREEILRLHDDSITKKMPWASFQEKTGGDFKKWQKLCMSNQEPGQAVRKKG